MSKSSKNWDPMFLMVGYILNPFKKGKLTKEETKFVYENTRKHANILWINLVSIILVVIGLNFTPKEAIGQVITALLAPVVVMGGAWFAITFGGIPERLLHVSMAITFWMFLGFLVSLSAMFIALSYVVYPVIWPTFAVIYMGAFISCVLYDTADGLKAGLDEALLKHSRAAIMYYRKQGIQEEENQ